MNIWYNARGFVVNKMENFFLNFKPVFLGLNQLRPSLCELFCEHKVGVKTIWFGRPGNQVICYIRSRVDVRLNSRQFCWMMSGGRISDHLTATKSCHVMSRPVQRPDRSNHTAPLKRLQNVLLTMYYLLNNILHQ